jgi:DNA-binding NtrC family response regulator
MSVRLALGLLIFTTLGGCAQDPGKTLPMDTTKTVLVIGRHADMLVRVTTMLRANGYNASGAATNQEAMALFSTGHFKVVLIGGGVDEGSRELFRLEFTRQQPGVQVLDAHPQTILRQLETAFKE